MSDVTAWKCEVCGYVHEEPEPPATCPVCGVDQEMFSPEGGAPGRAFGAGAHVLALHHL